MVSSLEWRQFFRYSPAADRAMGEAALLPRTWARANRNWGCEEKTVDKA